MSQITYHNPTYFENNQCIFYMLKVRDNEDVEYMFVINSIELDITLQ